MNSFNEGLEPFMQISSSLASQFITLTPQQKQDELVSLSSLQKINLYAILF
tara:strand:- start:2683 stop:2835 length:153 start_codon:yes stop_codon:yes gene_type:complete